MDQRSNEPHAVAASMSLPATPFRFCLRYLRRYQAVVWLMVVLEGGEFTLARPASGTYYARLQVIDALGVADPMGATQQFDMPVPRWLKVLLGSTVLLPLLL